MNESSRRGVTIGASIAAVVVLLAGMGVFLASRGGGDDDVASVRRRAVRRARRVRRRRPRPTVPDSTTTTTPLTAVANAGVDLAVDVGATVELAASGLTAGTPDDGGRVDAVVGARRHRAGRARSAGRQPTFDAPDDVSTVTLAARGDRGERCRHRRS